MANKRQRLRAAGDALRHLLDDERITSDLTQEDTDRAALLKERFYEMANRIPRNDPDHRRSERASHDLYSTVRLGGGFVAYCLCGWASPMVARDGHAQDLHRQHRQKAVKGVRDSYVDGDEESYDESCPICNHPAASNPNCRCGS